MNFSEIKEIIALINQSNLTEFQVKDQQFELYLSKNQTKTIEKASNSEVHQPVHLNGSVSSSMETIAKEVPTETTSSVEGEHQITSPLVGVIYLKPSPDKEVFKKIGDPVKKGEVVCIIEAMKVMNEIVSDVDGVITNVRIENEEVVEFGQALFDVKEG